MVRNLSNALAVKEVGIIFVSSSLQKKKSFFCRIYFETNVFIA